MNAPSDPAHVRRIDRHRVSGTERRVVASVMLPAPTTVVTGFLAVADRHWPKSSIEPAYDGRRLDIVIGETT